MARVARCLEREEKVLKVRVEERMVTKVRAKVRANMALGVGKSTEFNGC